MIVIDPTPSKTCPAAARLRRRDLSRFLSRAVRAIGLRGEVSVLLAGDERIRALNREFRHHDKSTDVLSFPAAPMFSARHAAGDLAISLETAMRQAAEHGHTLETEVKILMLHGLLHLAGYDHETDSGDMARQENGLRSELELPPGLIERGDSPVGQLDRQGKSPPSAKRAGELPVRVSKSRNSGSRKSRSQDSQSARSGSRASKSRP
jgi:probable rRNA maturation factor